MTGSREEASWEELLENPRWLHGLARALVGPSDADDLVQDARLAVLAGGTAGPVTRPFLAGLLRNLARRRLRTEGRRRARERDVREPSPSPSPDALLERTELQHRVLGAVLALPAPYREAVLLRHFEALSPQRAARRLGVPASTVRTRLQRAHELLRARLADDAPGTLRGLLAPLLAAPVPRATLAATLHPGGAVAVVGLVLGVVLASRPWLARGEPTRPGPRSEPHGLAVQEPGTRSSLFEAGLALSEATSRVAVPDPEGPPDTASASEDPRAEYAVQGRVRVSTNLPLRRPMGLFLTGPGGVQAGSEWQVGSDGRFSITDLGPGVWDYTFRSIGFRPVDGSFHLSPEHPLHRLDVVLEPQPLLEVRVLAPDGRTLGSVRAEGGHSFPIPLPVATDGPPGEVMPEVWGSANNHFGAGAWWGSSNAPVPLGPDAAGFLLLDHPPPVHVSLVLHQWVLETRLVPAGATAVDFTLAPEGITDALSGLRLEVVDGSNGRAVPEASATIHGAYILSLDLDGSAVAAVGGLAPGRWNLQVSAAGYATRRLVLDLPPGEILDLGSIELGPPVPITGVVLDPDGRPAPARLRVFPFLDDGSLEKAVSAGAESGENGFRIEALPPGRWVLRAQDTFGPLVGHAECWAAPDTIVSTSGGPVEDVVLRLRPVGRLLLRNRGSGEDPVRFVIESARGIRVRTGNTGDLRLVRFVLPQDRYHLRLEGLDGVPRLDRDVVIPEGAVTIEVPPPAR